MLNSILETGNGANRFKTLMNEGAPPRDFASEIAKHCDPELADVVRAEFDELPRSFISTWLIAWRLADEAGQPFEMVSEAPSRPLEYAKAGRVAYRVEHDNDGVRMYVSHVLGHHADWFKPAAEGVSERFEAVAAV
jgi:hypothetical protein